MNGNIATVLAGLRMQTAAYAAYLGLTLNALHAFLTRPEVSGLVDDLVKVGRVTAGDKYVTMIMAQVESFTEEVTADGSITVEEDALRAMKALFQHLAILSHGEGEELLILEGLGDVMVESAARTAALRDLIGAVVRVTPPGGISLSGMTVEAASLNIAHRLAKGYSEQTAAISLQTAYGDPVLAWNSRGPGKIGEGDVPAVASAVARHLELYAAMEVQVADGLVESEEDPREYDGSWLGELYLDSIRESLG